MFEPRPSLQLAVDYVVTQCVRKYPLDKCSVCDVTALPCDPQVMCIHVLHNMHKVIRNDVIISGHLIVYHTVLVVYSCG